MNSETFERGETVGVFAHIGVAKFIAADEEMAWIRWLDGIRQQVLIADLRKLPPPFAIVNETCTCGAMLCVGEAQIYYAECAQANRVAEKINAAFVARMAEEKAGAK
jgi:hypothetical protein